MNFENKTVLVYGTGISGISAVSLLESVEARVILYDENTKLTKEKVKEKLAAGSKAKIILGVDIEFVVWCGVREAKKVSYYVVCTVGAIVGEGDDV